MLTDLQRKEIDKQTTITMPILKYRDMLEELNSMGALKEDIALKAHRISAANREIDNLRIAIDTEAKRKGYRTVFHNGSPQSLRMYKYSARELKALKRRAK